jgi:putative intracellular protease/amidase
MFEVIGKLVTAVCHAPTVLFNAKAPNIAWTAVRK